MLKKRGSGDMNDIIMKQNVTNFKFIDYMLNINSKVSNSNY